MSQAKIDKVTATLDRYITQYTVNAGHPPETVTLSKENYEVLKRAKDPATGAPIYVHRYKGVALTVMGG